MTPEEELKALLREEDNLFPTSTPKQKTNWEAETNPSWHPDQWAAPTDHLYDDVEMQQ